MLRDIIIVFREKLNYMLNFEILNRKEPAGYN